MERCEVIALFSRVAEEAQGSSMDAPSSTDKAEVSIELLPYLIVYKDGTLERLAGTEVKTAELDPETGVLSEDILIVPETGVSARLYRPSAASKGEKLPLVVYFHGGAFCIASASEPKYHASINKLVAGAHVVGISVDYRIAPEHPLPAAYEDSWTALQWVASQLRGEGKEESWLRDYVDKERVFLSGDSAGANIAHHLALRDGDLKLAGIVMIHPYFWGTDPIGAEAGDPARKAMVDGWWSFVCPSDKGGDDPLINPFVEGAPSVAGLACDRLLVVVAEKDILRDRGQLYYESVVKSGWRGSAEFVETKGVDHVFYIFDPDCQEAKQLIQAIASFINRCKNSPA